MVAMPKSAMIIPFHRSTRIIALTSHNASMIRVTRARSFGFLKRRKGGGVIDSGESFMAEMVAGRQSDVIAAGGSGLGKAL